MMKQVYALRWPCNVDIQLGSNSRYGHYSGWMDTQSAKERFVDN